MSPQRFDELRANAESDASLLSPSDVIECLDEISRLAALVYVPGSFHCPVCKFQLVKSVLYVKSGTIGVEHHCDEKCPNDALFADCGLGKTPMQLVWGENVRGAKPARARSLTPLAVAQQTAREAEKFGIDAALADGQVGGPGIVITNYEKLHHFDPDDFAGVVCDESSILKSSPARPASGSRGSCPRCRTACSARRRPPRTTTSSWARRPRRWASCRTATCSGGSSSSSTTRARSARRGSRKRPRRSSRRPALLRKLAYRIAQTIGQWRLKHHAVTPSGGGSRRGRGPAGCRPTWGSTTTVRAAAAVERDHVIKPATPPPDMLFNVPGVRAGRGAEERRGRWTRAVRVRRDLVDARPPGRRLVPHERRGDRLEKVIPGASRSPAARRTSEKVELYEAFADGSAPRPGHQAEDRRVGAELAALQPRRHVRDAQLRAILPERPALLAVRPAAARCASTSSPPRARSASWRTCGARPRRRPRCSRRWCAR
jgi:hypothetical protein